MGGIVLSPEKVNLFLLFLGKNKALHKYKRNFSNFRKDNMREWLEFHHIHSYIDSAFIWACTPENDNFWDNLRNEWDDFEMKKVKINIKFKIK